MAGPLLWSVTASNNKIRTVPIEVLRIPSLQLDIRNNQIRTLPKEVCALPVVSGQSKSRVLLAGNPMSAGERARLLKCSPRFEFVFGDG